MDQSLHLLANGISAEELAQEHNIDKAELERLLAEHAAVDPLHMQPFDYYQNGQMMMYPNA